MRVRAANPFSISPSSSECVKRVKRWGVVDDVLRLSFYTPPVKRRKTRKIGVVRS